MPVTTLYVEGPQRQFGEEQLENSDALELPILAAVFGGRPQVEGGGPKGSLKPKTWDARGKGVIACYLRDRDFDAAIRRTAGTGAATRAADASAPRARTESSPPAT